MLTVSEMATARGFSLRDKKGFELGQPRTAFYNSKVGESRDATTSC
jgi:hypothetical protein